MRSSGFYTLKYRPIKPCSQLPPKRAGRESTQARPAGLAGRLYFEKASRCSELLPESKRPQSEAEQDENGETAAEGIEAPGGRRWGVRGSADTIPHPVVPTPTCPHAPKGDGGTLLGLLGEAALNSSRQHPQAHRHFNTKIMVRLRLPSL